MNRNPKKMRSRGRKSGRRKKNLRRRSRRKAKMPTKRRTVPTRNRPKRNRPGGSGRSLPPASKRKGKTQRRELIFSCCSFKLPATKAAETAAVIFFFQHTTKKFDCPINTSAVLPKTYEKSPENRGFFRAVFQSSNASAAFMASALASLLVLSIWL